MDLRRLEREIAAKITASQKQTGPDEELAGEHSEEKTQSDSLDQLENLIMTRRAQLLGTGDYPAQGID